jgi:hypothetical protein
MLERITREEHYLFKRPVHSKLWHLFAKFCKSFFTMPSRLIPKQARIANNVLKPITKD